MEILAIDPGSEQSAYVVYDSSDAHVLCKGLVPNDDLMIRLRGAFFLSPMAIEMIACYGMAVGKTVFETCVWIGRFVESVPGRPYSYVYRREVKMHLCNSARAKDGNVRQALIDRFPATGGGSIPQIGTKKAPGPLYGVKKDIWAALGVAVTFADARDVDDVIAAVDQTERKIT